MLDDQLHARKKQEQATNKARAQLRDVLRQSLGVSEQDLSNDEFDEIITRVESSSASVSGTAPYRAAVDQELDARRVQNWRASKIQAAVRGHVQRRAIEQQDRDFGMTNPALRVRGEKQQDGLPSAKLLSTRLQV